MIRVLALVFLTLWPLATAAQELTALARPLDGAALRNAGGGVALNVPLSQAVPFRIRHLNDPPRLVIDFREVDWAGLDLNAFNQSDRIADLRAGQLSPGWSRMVLDLRLPMIVESAAMTTGDVAGFALLLRSATDAEFAEQVRAVTLPQAETAQVELPKLDRQDGSRPVRVVLDPGHGGIDPGAQRDGVVEAHLMLTFARELRDLLRRDGFEVTLTREADVFVPLEARMTRARAAQADVFLSLHADALPEGYATGATIYTLSDAASGAAAQLLAERHDRADLLSGVDLTRQDDVIAGVLMDLARQDTAPRSDALARALVAGLRANIDRLHKNPHQSAAFSVLKAPDIPSALIELGFLSSKNDLENLTDAEWRLKAAAGIRDALQVWARDDAANAQLLRQ
ncbi:hypothetical protein ACMU_17285 [Actibacterium mucosum KCTC 23349]|uniref:N-acetylmuramoyl-L-alanine amidase n=1 Tax=Actibacterium mucosum KCTC 23349 TaxID=1454373 RepID=A0A037ZEB7_9RHOB|nr:N-acetylmuramoyl-L-alanine amidase [Actibacterium mucosum]KAJ54462.1 hypothetical protein ACMU_17285 [Actibacterium mucosum KCTC 23349]